MTAIETATLLFSDLVDSTAITVSLDAASAAELRTSLFAVHREEIERVGGRQVKTLGDGVMAVFTNASSGIEAAVGIQRRVDRLDRRVAHPVRVRIGMSAGDVEHVDGDCFGEPVVEAARLCAVAEPGSILVAELVRLLAGRTVAASFGPSRPFELKGLPDPVPACTVDWEQVEPGRIPLVWPAASERTGPFFGRGPELARFDDALGAVEEGHARVVALTGESGIGKSSTAQELATRAHRRGALVLAGRAREELPVPFGPYLAPLAHLVAHLDASVLAEHVSEHGGELRRLVPDLGERIGLPPAPPESDPETERYRLFRAVSGLLGDVSAAGPTVLVLDDLHFADLSTVRLTRFLADEAISGLLLLCVYRSNELAAENALHDLRADQLRAGRLVALDLDGFESPVVATLIEHQLGRPLERGADQLTEAITRETAGNPFFVSEVVRHLVEVGELRPDGTPSEPDALLTGSLPSTVVHVVSRRVQRLGEQVERLLGGAAVLGAEFDVALLTELLELEEGAVVDGLDAAAAAELVRLLPGPSARCAFTHAIVRRTLYRNLSALRRRHLHRRTAEVLEGRAAEGSAGAVTEIARHAYEGRDPSTTGVAIERALLAAERAGGQLAPDEAARWYGRALEMADEIEVEADLRCRLLVGLGIAQRDAGAGDYRDTLHRAGTLARELGSASLLAESALANFRGFWSTSGSVDEERIDELQAAREALGDTDDPVTARILATTAVELGYGEDEGHRLSLADEALAMARRLDQPATLAYLLRTWELVHRLPWYLDQRARVSAEHAALAQRLGDPVEQFWAVNNGSIVALERGDAGRFDALLPGVLPAAAATGQRLLEWIGGFVAVSAHVIRCEWDAAESLMERTYALGVACGQPDADAVYASHLFEIRRGQGRVDELVDLLVAVQAAAPEIEAFRPALGVCFCDLDRTDGRELFAEDVADRFGRYRHNGMWLVSMTMNAEIAAFFDHVEAAALLYEVLLPCRDHVGWTGTTASPSAAEAAGVVATTLERFDEAEDLLGQSLEVHRRLQAPGWTAGSLVSTAALLGRRRRPGDLDRARVLLAEADDLASRSGAATIARKAAVLADRL